MADPRSVLDDLGKIQDLDRSDMAGLLARFAEQVEEAIEIGERFRIPSRLGSGIEKILFVGMGGSAIGGDVIRSLIGCESSIPIWVSRHYDLPPFADRKTLCIFSSYSGNTEETLAAFHQGRKRGLKSLILTAGGELSRLSERYGVPWIQIPQGFPPRAALGYSVFPMLKLLAGLKVCKWDSAGIRETIAFLRRRAEACGPKVGHAKNPAKQWAESLHGRLVMIYAGTELLDSAALRFRNQIEENAKAMASHHLLPEMNHNEILGWKFPKGVLAQSACVFLRDALDHPRIQLRVEITKKVIGREKIPILEMHSEGKSRLARLFSVTYWGDWISYYLALLYRIDPTPVTVIEFLKKELAAHR